jgi:hypothetical protein
LAGAAKGLCPPRTDDLQKMALPPETWKHHQKNDADLRLSLDACHGIAEKQVNAVYDG